MNESFINIDKSFININKSFPLTDINKSFINTVKPRDNECPESVNTPFSEHFSPVPVFLKIHFSFMKSEHPLIRTVNTFWVENGPENLRYVNISVQVGHSSCISCGFLLSTLNTSTLIDLGRLSLASVNYICVS